MRWAFTANAALPACVNASQHADDGSCLEAHLCSQRNSQAPIGVVIDYGVAAPASKLHKKWLLLMST
jgi:hypothetical protein